jgi:4-hydroxybenzoate polyprenyltransferase
MWRAIVGYETQTAAEKRAGTSGINLFFGALIGANLGSLERLALRDYVLMICIVALIVLYIQLAPVARKRWTNLLHLAAMVGGLYVLLMTPMGASVFGDRPRPSPHLFVTIALWLASIAVIQMRPVREEPERPVAD